MTEMRQTRRNEQRTNGTLYNEQIYNRLGKREIAFKYGADAFEERLFVFKIPNQGQMIDLASTEDDDMAIFRKTQITLSVLLDTVRVPEDKDEFEVLYRALELDEAPEFVSFYKDAMEAKEKK